MTGSVLEEKRGFLLIYVETRGTDFSRFYAVKKRVRVNKRTARCVQYHNALLHLLYRFCIYHVPCIVCQRAVQGYDIALLEQLVQRNIVYPAVSGRKCVIGDNVHSETAADIYENYIEWQYADADPDGYINGLFYFTGLGFYNAALVDYEATLVVTVDDEGNFIISPEDGFMPDPYTELPINYDAIIRYSLDNLLGWGHITQEQYDSLNESLYLGNGPVTELECGPDYYLAFIERYNEADYNDLTLEFWTRESYDPGVVFTYDMTVNGEPFESGSLETEGYGQFDFAIDLPDEYTTEGNSIDLMIYGADGSLLAHLQLNF